MENGDGYLRIGELARRTGTTPELLRAWEQRYGLLRPSRSPGGFRLYSNRDEARVRRTRALIARGLSAAEAAGRVIEADAEVPEGRAPRPGDLLAADLEQALDALDGEEAHRAFDRLVAGLSVEALLEDVLLPYLRRLGERWATGEISVAHEHFASNLLRGRLLGLARDWGVGRGPSIVLACPPGEEHEFGLMMFGIVLSRRGWRVTYLGADTPFEALETTVRRVRPQLVVLASLDPGTLDGREDEVRRLGALAPVALGGRVAPEQADRAGARRLEGGPVGEARAVSTTWAAAR